jgi:hypothetical protein
VTFNNRASNRVSKRVNIKIRLLPVLIAPQIHDIGLEFRVQGLQIFEGQFVERDSFGFGQLDRST